MIIKEVIKRVGAGIMAGICAVSMFGASIDSVLTASAATQVSEEPVLPTADEVVAQAAKLLGTPYVFGAKGASDPYYGSGNDRLYTADEISGIDCSGLVYWTLFSLGYKTSGFMADSLYPEGDPKANNPVPIDTMHWLNRTDDATITYDGVTSKVQVLKEKLPTPSSSESKTYEYWEKADGSTIEPGSVVVAEKDGINHAWIYIGEFDSRADVVSYLKEIGVPSNLITSQTVYKESGNNSTHWRIESRGDKGVVINNSSDGKLATAMYVDAFRITENEAEFTIEKLHKKDGSSNTVTVGASPVDGSTAVYGIYSDSKCTNLMEKIDLGSDGKATFKLPRGEYWVKEIEAPTGWELSDEIVKLKEDDTVFLYEDKLRGSITINKTAEDGIIGDRTFKVTWTQEGEKKTKNATTNSKGVATFTGLDVYDVFGTGDPIKYTVEEIAETQYVQPKSQTVTLVDGDADLTTKLTFNNELKKGTILINKQSEDGENGGRTFTITGGGKTYTVKTNSDGVAKQENLPVYNSNNKAITYTIYENNVPIRYVVPAEQEVTFIADATVNVTFDNVLKKFTVEVVKTDAENKTAQGDATLEGAVYGMYADGELLDEYVTDKNGYFRTKEYVCTSDTNPVTYVIKEITPSEGYTLDTTEHEVGAEAKNYTIEHNTIDMSVVETVIKGNIAIIKHCDNGDTQIETPEVGAEFEVYLKSAGSYEAADEDERDILVCDEDGFAQTKDLPYGTYIVHQTKGWPDAEFIADFEVVVAEDGKTYKYLINNQPFYCYIKIVKTDAETGKAIAYEGAGFEIYDADGEKVSMSYTYPKPTTIDVFYTNDEGYLITPDVLTYGDYTLVEVQAPEGYVLDSTPISFKVSRANAVIEDALELVRVEKTNAPQKGYISVQKTGDSFTTVTTSEENIYTPVFEIRGLAGAVFEITAAEDIITLDGTVRANAGDVVATITTDENGFAQTDLLYLGKYNVKEITAPYGYVLSGATQTVEITYAGQEVQVAETVETSFVNLYQLVNITLSKYMEVDELFGIGSNDEKSAVRFGLFAAEDIIAADGTYIPADGLISEISLDEDMKADFDVKLPFGKYYVQEIATDDHYIINGEKFLVTFEYMGQDIETVNIECGEFENFLKRGSVSGLKISSADEKPLANAVFGLFAVNAAEFTADTAYKTATSDENGRFEFTDIPYGQYIVKEITAPEAYVLSDEQFPVTIGEDGDVIEITVVNEEMTGRVEINKSTVGDVNISGIELILSGTSDTGREINMTATTDENGIAVFEEVPIGTYTVSENGETVPVAYLVADEQSVEVIYGKTVNLTFFNEEKSGDIVINKSTTKGDDLEGIKFIVSGTTDSGREVSFEAVTDKDGKATFVGIPVGTYTITEDGSTVPFGYYVAEPFEVTVIYAETVACDVFNTGEGTFQFTKTDVSDGKLIPNCEIAIYDEDGNVVVSGVTDENGYIEFVLPEGKYYYQEIKAPEGYLIDNGKYEFVISVGEITKAHMTNEKIPEPEVPQTGMTATVNPISIALSAIVLVIAAVVVIRKKTNR